MHYSRPTLVSDWHSSREAEPKDYDFSLCAEGQKKLHVSTYKNLGTCTESGWSTTTGSEMGQHLQKGAHQPRIPPQAQGMVTAELLLSVDFDQHTLDRAMDTTYAVDYPCEDYPCDLSPGPVSMDVIGWQVPRRRPEGHPNFRKRLSQFTDTSDHRRHGHHTFQDESGSYALLGDRPYGHAQAPNPICP
ncbi:cilia- and flagella-associated protein 95-like [Aplochiton taeniatus]